MEQDDDNEQIQLKELGSNGSIGPTPKSFLRSRSSVRDRRGYSLREGRPSGGFSGTLLDSVEGKTPRTREAVAIKYRRPG